MLTDVPGFLVGHATMETAITGCTVIICPPETRAGVEVLGGWPATREMAILSPLSSSPHIHAILFTGRSVYGLAAADGVVRWIEEQRGEIPQVPGVVAALAVVNAVGDVFDRDGRIIAGAHDADGRHIDFFEHVAGQPRWPDEQTGSNTTLVAVATNAQLTKTQCSIVAHMAQAGFPRAINPIFTPWDGDTVIVASSGSVPASDFTIGVLAAEEVADSIRDAVRQAASLGGVPDLGTPGTRSADDPAWSVEPARH